jgi:hypothetical protein
MKYVFFLIFVIGFAAAGLRVYQHLYPSDVDLILKDLKSFEQSIIFNSVEAEKFLTDAIELEIDAGGQKIRAASKSEALELLRRLHSDVLNFSTQLKKIDFLESPSSGFARIRFEAWISGQLKESPLSFFNPKTPFEIQFSQENGVWKINQIKTLGSEGSTEPQTLTEN